MAGRRPTWPDRAARLSALEVTVGRRDPDGERTLRDICSDLDPDAQLIVERWSMALQAPAETAARAGICCTTHGLRRMYAWLRTTQPATADDLALIERGNVCT